MKTAFLAIVLTLLSSAAFACNTDEVSFEKSQLCAKVTWLQGPAFNQYSSAQVRLNENTDLKLNVIPWMIMGGGHEHGSRPVTITNSSPSDYLVEKIYIMGGMTGQWFLKLQLLNDKKEIVEEVRTLINL